MNVKKQSALKAYLNMQRAHGMLEGITEAMEIYKSHSEIDGQVADKLVGAIKNAEDILNESLEEMKYVFDLIDPQYY